LKCEIDIIGMISLMAGVMRMSILKSLDEKKKHREWQMKYDLLAPKVGEITPDFVLADSSDENSVRLSDYRGKKPVALIFGSYT
jgi:hypothetical protein